MEEPDTEQRPARLQLVPRSPAAQGWLFHQKSASGRTPPEVVGGLAAVPASPDLRGAAPPRPAPKSPARRTSKVPEAQTRLDFFPGQQTPSRKLGTTVEAVIFCEAPVALPLHRLVAATLDWIMVLLGYGLFLAAFSLYGGGFVLNKTNLLVFGAVLPLIGFTYGFIWALANTETAGMRWARLRLITFDGFPPDRKQRMLRFLGSTLGFCTLVGLLWSLADEESLTWGDHISGTFPTPLELESRVFRRC